MVMPSAYSRDANPTWDINEAALSKSFVMAAHEIPPLYADNLNGQNKSTAEQSENWDVLELNPWQVTLHDQLYTLISKGHYEKAMDLVQEHLTNYSTAHAIGSLEALDRVLYTLDTNGYNTEVSAFLEALFNEGWFQSFTVDLSQGLNNLFTGDSEREMKRRPPQPAAPAPGMMAA